MNWATMQAGLLAWFIAALGVDDDGQAIHADWEDEPETFSANPLLGQLKIRNISSVGNDETRYIEDGTQPLGAELVPTQVGNRRMTVSFAVEAHQLTPAWSAHRFLDRVRSKLRLPSSTETFRGLGLGVLGVEAIQVVDGEVDGRRLGKAVLDVHFSFAACYRDTDNGVSYISTIGLTTHLQDPGGVELPAPPNLVDETVPS